MTEKKWDKKLTVLREHYPEIKNIDWSLLLQSNSDVFHEIITNISKKQPGKKHINNGAQLVDQDYSELSFVESFNILWGDNTIATMSQKTGISNQLIYAMKRGQREPTFEDMEKIAKAFYKDPSFFLEYRIGYILSSIDRYLQNSPETAVVWYKKVVKNKGLKI